MAHFGMLRMVRDAFAISGKIQYDQKGNILQVVLNKNHTLASLFYETWQYLFPRNDLLLILGEI
jgi:hypothetical protein